MKLVNLEFQFQWYLVLTSWRLHIKAVVECLVNHLLLSGTECLHGNVRLTAHVLLRYVGLAGVDDVGVAQLALHLLHHGLSVLTSSCWHDHRL